MYSDRQRQRDFEYSQTRTGRGFEDSYIVTEEVRLAREYRAEIERKRANGEPLTEVEASYGY